MMRWEKWNKKEKPREAQIRFGLSVFQEGKLADALVKQVVVAVRDKVTAGKYVDYVHVRIWRSSVNSDVR